MYRGIIPGILALLLCSVLSAQKPSLYFEKLTTQNGLSNNTVNCVIQDQRGFIWFGTDDGLNRYDGYNFVVYRHEPNNSTSISGNIINGIVEDEQGILWIATGDGGLTRYDYRAAPAQQFKQYKHIPGDTSTIPGNIINTLLMDPQGYLWLGTSNFNVVRFNRKTEHFERPVRRGTRTVLALSLDHKGIIWAGKEGGGLLKINPANLSYEMDERYFNLYAKLPHAAVTSIYSDKEKNVWFGSWDKVLYRQPNAPVAEEVFKQDASSYSFTNDEVDCFAEDSEGHLWIGGRHSGLQLFDKKTGRFYNYQHDPAKEGTIADNHINCLFMDNRERIWIGTDKGISVYHPLQKQFIQNFLPATKDGNDITIYDFYKTNNELWIGTSEGIYIRKDADHSYEYRPLTYKGNKLSVTRFFKDIDGTFYLGTNYSLFVYDIANNKVSLLPNTEKDSVMNKIIESRVVSIVRDTIEDRPVLIVAPYGHFICYYDLQEKRWVSRMDTAKNIVVNFNLQDNLIRKLYKTHDGRLWQATGRMGLGEWVQHSLPKVQQLSNNPVKNNSISSDNVYDLTEDADGNLWVSTYGGGLNYFNTRNKQFTHIPATNNLVEGIQVDNRGYVWMISNGNLHQYHALRKSHISINLPDIEKSGGVKGYIYQDDKGHMYVAGLNYFIEFDPFSIRHVKEMSQVYLTDFKIFNQSYSDLLLKDKISLNYNQNYFRVEFAAPDFSAGRHVQYAYMLQGRDRDWIPIGNQNYEQFSNLDGGDYVFKVRVTNNAGVWSSETSVPIKIIPPFWKTWWFYALCALVTALIIYAIYRYRINELLKMQAIRNKIAQDLHDNVGSTLSSISVYSQVAKIYNQQQRAEELQQTIEKIGATSSEMISEMNDIVWAINPRNDSMNTILQRMDSYARPLLTTQGITFHFTTDPDIKNMNLEMTRRKNFYLIFKESVNNAMKYSGCSHLWVHIGINSHLVSLSVKDNGKGFDLQQLHVHTSRSLSGNGLRNMEMRAAEMKGVWTIDSEPGVGTTVRLQFPIT